ncbi:MAG: NAD(P)/FAD-dependent oxidoreductase [Peptococcaceae bacterium]
MGGGIIGLASAYYLTKANKRVLLIEKNEIGAGASGACDDMILLQSKRPGILLSLALESLLLYRSLAKELPVNIELENRGGMVLIESAEQLSVMENFIKQQQASGLDVTLFEREQIKKYQPFASEHLLASTYSSLDSQVNPLKTMQAFLVAANSKGLSLKKGSGVKNIEFIDDYKWKVTTDDNVSYMSEFVINAAGAWANNITELIDIHFPIKPKKGQIAVTEQIPTLGKTNIWSADYIVMKLNPELARGRPVILNELGIGLAFSQTSDGNYFIGGSREYVGFDVSTNVQGINLMIKEATRFFPILKNVHIIRTFAGLRPASDDGKPYLGPLPERPGFLMAAGHEGDGIALAPITGKILSLMVTNKKYSYDLTELSPVRAFNGVLEKTAALK